MLILRGKCEPSELTKGSRKGLPVDECAKKEEEEDGNQVQVGLPEELLLKSVIELLDVAFQADAVGLMELFANGDIFDLSSVDCLVCHAE